MGPCTRGAAAHGATHLRPGRFVRGTRRRTHREGDAELHPRESGPGVQPSPPDAQEIVLEGASLGIGRAVGARVKRMDGRRCLGSLDMLPDLPLVSARSGVINRSWILLIRTSGAAGSY